MAGTIKIQDLANAMNKNPKELLFELQSIGVKVQSVDDVIPPEVVQALISGKPLEAPNQVIIREDRGRERKVKKTLKTRIPRVKVLTQKDIPVIDIPKKSTLQEVEEMIPASEPEAPPVQEVPVKEEAPAPSRPARDRKSVV